MRRRRVRPSHSDPDGVGTGRRGRYPLTVRDLEEFFLLGSGGHKGPTVWSGNPVVGTRTVGSGVWVELQGPGGLGGLGFRRRVRGGLGLKRGGHPTSGTGARRVGRWSTWGAGVPRGRSIATRCSTPTEVPSTHGQRTLNRGVGAGSTGRKGGGGPEPRRGRPPTERSGPGRRGRPGRLGDHDPR